MKKEWTETTLKDVCLRPTQWKPDAEPRGDFFYIDVSAVSNDTFSITAPQAVTGRTAPGRARKIVHSRDVIYATIRPTLKRVALVSPEYDNHIVSTAFCVIRANREKASPEFLYFLLLSDPVSKAIADAQHGASYPAVTDKDILKQEVSLPPLPEQKKIAAVLLKIQRAIETQEKIIKSLRALKRSTMQHLFTHGLRGEKTKMTEIGEIPESWEVVRIGDVSESCVFGPRFSADLYSTDGNVTTLRTTDISDDGRIDYTDAPKANLDLSRLETHLMKEGDCVVTRSGTCGIAAVYEGHERPVLPGAFLIRVRFSAAVLPHFFRQYINSPIGQQRISVIARGAIQKNISGTSLLGFMVPLPEKPDQYDLVVALAGLDAKLAQCESKEAALQFLFKTTLNKLMTGGIRVADLDIDVREVEG